MIEQITDPDEDDNDDYNHPIINIMLFICCVAGVVVIACILKHFNCF